MTNKEIGAVEQAADVVDAYLPEAMRRLKQSGVPEDHEQYQALKSMSVGVRHTEPEYPRNEFGVFWEDDTQPVSVVQEPSRSNPFGDDNVPGF